jgi:hypothetical protein
VMINLDHQGHLVELRRAGCEPARLAAHHRQVGLRERNRTVRITLLFAIGAFVLIRKMKYIFLVTISKDLKFELNEIFLFAPSEKTILDFSLRKTLRNQKYDNRKLTELPIGKKLFEVNYFVITLVYF